MSGLDYRVHALNVVNNIYSNMPIKDVKLVNFNGNTQENSVVGLVNKVVTGVNALKA